jgi:glycerate 2-kinase
VKNKSICSDKLAPHVARFASGFVEQALAACDLERLIEQHMNMESFRSPTHLIAFGKASAAMATACRDRLRDRFAGGVVLCPDEQIPLQGESIGLEFHGVDHPNPTSRNVQATQRVIEYARSIPADHSCLVCISGGGSAHLCSPASGVTLDEIIERTRALNAAGSTIQQLNLVRKQLETLKGGGLARELSHDTHAEACVLSDVMGDDLDTIASGPLRDAEHSIKHTIIGNHWTLRSGCVAYIRGLGFDGNIEALDALGESSDAGRSLAALYADQQTPTACIATGETTVDASGSKGVGGPCMEMVLAAGVELKRLKRKDWVMIGLASDGIDGPTDVAGAVLTPGMLADQGVLQYAHKALEMHDSLTFLRSIDAQIVTGATGTNLNDVVLIAPSEVLGKA